MVVMPNMQTTIHGFEDTFQFQIVQKATVDHDTVESSKVKPVLWFEGAIQPMPSRDLLIKPEGERKFKWWILYTDMELELDAIIKDPAGSVFRVMSTSNWNQSGYQQYQLTEGPGV